MLSSVNILVQEDAGTGTWALMRFYKFFCQGHHQKEAWRRPELFKKKRNLSGTKDLWNSVSGCSTEKKTQLVQLDMMAAQKLLDVHNVYSLFLLLKYWTSKYQRRNKDENLGDKKRMQFFWRQRDHQNEFIPATLCLVLPLQKYELGLHRDLCPDRLVSIWAYTQQKHKWKKTMNSPLSHLFCSSISPFLFLSNE